MANWDVIVIGLGGVGSSAAYHLAAAGQQVLGIDQFGPAHDRGSSHGQTRIIRQAYFEDPAYVPLLRRAYPLWDELQDRSGTELFLRTGLVELGPRDGIVIPGVLRSAAEHDLELEVLSSQEVTSQWPGIRGDEDWQAVIEHNAGLLLVEDCVQAHLRLAGQAGATCKHHVRVQQWRCQGAGVEVQTDAGVEHAASLVIAGGPWSAQLLSELNVPLQVLRKHQYWFDTDAGGFEVESGFPCFFHETAEGFFYGFPSLNRSGVKVARHSGGQPISGPEPEHFPDPEDQAFCHRYVSCYLPGVSDRLLAHRGCYYTVTPDEHFIVDRHPAYENVVLIAGLSGHGFKFTSVLGQLAMELTLQGTTSLDTRLFRCDRPAMKMSPR
jgi:sarcosine oxidase